MTIDNKSRGVKSALLTILFFFSLAVPGVFAQKTKDMPLTATEPARALFIQAREKAENLEDTGALFDQVIQKDPNFAFGYLFAGQTNPEIQKNLATAESLAGKASPGEREWILAARDARNGDIAGQLVHLEQLVKLYPNDKRVHMQIAQYYRNRGDDATALKHFADVVKIDKKYAPVYNLIGYENMALGKYPEAESAFQSYIKLIPNNANPYDSYAEFLMKTGKFDASIKQYQMALSKDPTFVNSYRGMGNDYEYKGDYAKSRETYQTMFDRSTNDFNRDQALSSAMNSWIAEGNVEKALEVNDHRIAMAEKVGDVNAVIGLHNLAALICAETGDAAGAEKHLGLAAKWVDDPSLRTETKGNRLFNTQSQQVRFLTARSDFVGARTRLEDLRQYASTRVNFERAYNTSAGNVELAQKNYAKANEFYAKGNPQDVNLWYSSALAYEGIGDTKSAMDLYRKVAEFNELDTVGYALVRARAVAKVKN